MRDFKEDTKELSVRSSLYSEYGNWLFSLKRDIRSAQIKASVAVNSEMLE